jgi:RNA polymerase sigma-70 factor (ECF subfamily)
MANPENATLEDESPSGTSIIAEPASQETKTFDDLIASLYSRLKPLAARVRWNRNSTLGPTVLLHEAYLKLLNSKDLEKKPVEEVIGIFVNVMRQIMVDAARRKRSLKRGGGAIMPLTSEGTEPSQPKSSLSPEDILSLERAIAELRTKNPRQADIIERRFYLGLTVDETATLMDVSKTTVEREDREAKIFLSARIRPRLTSD